MLGRTTFSWALAAGVKTGEATALAERMVEWFLTHYEDPVNNTPYDGGEGGYQYMCGGPYYAREELSCEFSDAAGFSVNELEEIIDIAVHEIEHGDLDSDGSGRGDCYEWARIIRSAPLLRVHDHQWGKGHVHRLESDKTACGKKLENCPGDRAWGNEDDITCKACLRLVERR
jgi:hypothetical protein